MGKSQETFSKKEKEKKRQRRREEKAKKKAERQESNNKGGSLDDMIAYVDENGNISDAPPDPTKKKKVKVEDIQISVPKKEDLEGPVVHEGRVEFFNHDKGFGFIREFDTDEKYFVHISRTMEEIDEGDKVAYDLEQGPRGINAVDVKKI